MQPHFDSIWNKEAAQQCKEKAKEFMYQKNWEKAIRFLKKGKRLDKSLEKECDDLIKEVEEKQKTNPSSS